MEPVSFKSRFSHFDTKRSIPLERARDCAELTIPSLLPRSGANENTELYTPYQGLGARGVNNLASKLLLTLLPPNSPFFRLAIDQKTLNEMGQDDAAKTAIEKELAKLERIIMAEVETTNSRTVLFETLKHLIVSGNGLLYMPAEGGMRLFKLSQYVVRRDGMGNVMEILIEESISPSMLEDDVREAVGADNGDEKEKNVSVYTRCLRGKSSWTYSQQINGVTVPGSDSTSPLDQPKYLALRLSALVGEDYGRGLVEEYLGDLRSLEGLHKSIVTAAAASAKVVFLLNPNATTRKKDLAFSESGDIVQGNADDVSVLRVDKSPDLRVAREVIEEISARLAQAFLMNTAVQRNAERVTAEEIRYVAQELEDALGGIYSVLSQELQLPYVRRLITQLTKQKKLPPLPKGQVNPTITTGLEALGRGHDIAKLRELLSDLAPLGEQAIATYLNVGDYIMRAATARGVSPDGLIRTEEEVQQMQQQAQMAQLAQQAGPGAIQEMVKGGVKNMGGNQNG